MVKRTEPQPQDLAAVVAAAADAARDTAGQFVPAETGAFALRDIAAAMVNTVRAIEAGLNGGDAKMLAGGAEVQWSSPAVAWAYSHARTVGCPKVGGQWAPDLGLIMGAVDLVAAEYGRNPAKWQRRADTVTRASARARRAKPVQAE